MMESPSHLPSVPCPDSIHMQCDCLVPLWFCLPCLLHAREVLATFCAKRFFKIKIALRQVLTKITGASSRNRYLTIRDLDSSCFMDF